MAGRYLITGAQIGVLIALIRNDKLDEAIAELDKIFNDQFLGNSDNQILEDVGKLTGTFKSTK